MDEYQTKLLEYCLATNVLILAQQLKAISLASGKDTERDFVKEAVEMLNSKSGDIFQTLSKLV